MADPVEKNNLAAAGIPEDLRDTHARLKAALDKHLAITKEADPVLTKRRNELNRNR